MTCLARARHTRTHARASPTPSKFQKISYICHSTGREPGLIGTKTD